MAGKRIIVFCLMGLVALALAAFASSGSQAQTYKAFHGYSLANTLPAANSNSASSVGVYVPDYNYEDASMFTLTPIDMWSDMGYKIPVGAKMGVLSASSTVGVAGAACAATMTPAFAMHNATTDTTDVLDAAAMYWLLKDKVDEPIPFTDLPDPPYDDDLPDYLEAYPYFLNQMFDPDGAGPEPALIPRARYAGHAFVANMNILVQIVVFNPGQLSLLPGINAQMGPELGSASVVVLNNPISADEAPGAITDFCTPLETVTTLYGTTAASDYGVGGGDILAQQNPPAGAGVLGTGTIISRNYSRSERDADGDGIENDLDPCHYVYDTSWDPRAAGGAGTGDEDNDGLPDACDPHPNTYDEDEDDDGYTNKQDICPLNADGEATTNQQDSDTTLPNADLGPGPDSIGDACDDSDNDGKEDGTSTGVKGAGNCTDGIDNGDGDGLADELDPECIAWYDANDADPWSTNPGTGLFYHGMPWSAECVGTDSDGDGYCDGLETALGSPTDNGPETGTDCQDAEDDDSDGYYNDGCPPYGLLTAETGAECAAGDTVDDDADTRVNDGCPVIGVPESLVIDASIVAGDAQPSNAVPQSCSDGVDNDGDGDVDVNDADSLGCDSSAGHGYDTDADIDGVADGSDNCPAVWNPEQTDGDTKGVGDACDNDDDNDGWSDEDEWKAGSDPGDSASQPDVCDGVDNDGDGKVDEGYTDTDADTVPDCFEDTVHDADSDGSFNGPDLNDDNNPNADPFSDAKENFMGTDKEVMCSVGGADNDPLDNNKDGKATIADIMNYFAFGEYGSDCTADQQPYKRRLDLNADKKISIADIMEYFAFGQYGQSCPYGL